MSEVRHHSTTDQARRIDKYVFSVEDVLGEGNFSKVYCGINEITNYSVAIKQVRNAAFTSKIARRLLESYITILKSIEHPHIIRCYDVHSTANHCYIVTEYCNGGNLENLLQSKKKLKEMEITNVLVEVYDALEYLNTQAILHRDLKISNVLLHDGHCKLADFGFSIRSDKLFRDVPIGSPAYMSPEGLIGNLYGPKTDVWSFGLLIFELLTGKVPLTSCKTEEYLKDKILLLHFEYLTSAISPELRVLIERCLTINEKDRISIPYIGQTTYMLRLKATQQPQKLVRTLLINHQYEIIEYKYISTTTTLSSVYTNHHNIIVLPYITYYFAVALIHYCRLVHKICRIRPSQCLSYWVVRLSLSLVNARINCQESKEKLNNVRQIIQEYHVKYSKYHNDSKKYEVSFAVVLQECESQAEHCTYLSKLARYTALLRKCYEEKEFGIYASKSKCQQYINSIMT